jgi:predicted nucleic acid-binding protein
VYFDTDCISSFLWVKGEHLLLNLYPGRIVIPKQVYIEISSVPHLRARIDACRKNSDITITEILAGTYEHKRYSELTRNPKPGYAIIGKGEASSLVLAESNNGVVASNNLKDVLRYVRDLGLQHKTTGDIMMEALDSGLITEHEGNFLWSGMLSKRRLLGAASFTDYLHGRGR